MRLPRNPLFLSSRRLHGLLFVALALSPAGPIVYAQEPILGDTRAHDPSTMIEDSGTYFIFRTGTGIETKYSTDKQNWVYGGRVFPSGPPAWTTAAVPGFTGNFWAPDVAYFNGQYHLYYSCSTFGSQDSAIGLVTTPSLTSPTWTDQGSVIESNPGANTYNAIDPSIFVDSNNVYMAFGSFWDGIYLIWLDPTTGKKLIPSPPPVRLADYAQIEAACLFIRNGYYYLFVGQGQCCSGVDSTYRILVGRSTIVQGPYKDRNGTTMILGGGTLVLESTGRYVGPGHAAILVENGIDWFTYHYYDSSNSGIATLGLAQLDWTSDGWPVVTNDWTAFYTLEEDAREHLDQYDGTLQGGASVVDEPGRSKVLSLDGASEYVSLPDAVANASTFAAWVKWNGGDIWQRIFDFGDGTGRYLFLTPKASSGTMRFGITVLGNGNEQFIDAPSALPTGSWCHVAVTLEPGNRPTETWEPAQPGRCVMYLNGEPVSTNNAISVRPWQVLARDNFVGDSQFPADPLFDGLIDSFRVFGRVLSSAEIKDLAYAHPALAHRYSFAEDARDSIGGSHGDLMGNAIVTNQAVALAGVAGDYVDLPGGLVSGSATVSLEFWATLGANGSGAPVFHFGTTSGASQSQYLSFVPEGGAGSNRLSISTGGGTAVTDDPPSLNGTTVHAVCIVDPIEDYLAVYTNGVVAHEQFTPVPDLGGVSKALGYLGRSLNASDPWLNAVIDEFRIYDGRLTPEEITANFRAGPDALALPVELDQVVSATNQTLSWPAYAIDYDPESSGDLLNPAPWTPAAQTPNIADDRRSIVVPMTGDIEIYRLRR